MPWLKKVYLYIVSLISLVIMIVAAIGLLNMALKTWVFPKADNNYYPLCPTSQPVAPEKSAAVPVCDEAAQQKIQTEQNSAQKQRDAAQYLAMLIVGAPVFWYHWRLARKES